MCSRNENQLISIKGVWNDADVLKRVPSLNINRIIQGSVRLLHPLPILIASEILTS